MEENTVFNEEEFKENEVKKEKLVALIRSGDSILMAGAGVTANLYCSWSKLMDKFQQLAQDLDKDFAPRDEKEEYLPFADRVKSAIGENRYLSMIYDEFEDKNPPYEEYTKLL